MFLPRKTTSVLDLKHGDRILEKQLNESVEIGVDSRILVVEEHYN